jgi:hypothetical protein
LLALSSVHSQYYLGKSRNVNHSNIKGAFGSSLEITKAEKNFDRFLYGNTMYGQLYDANNVCIIETICPLNLKEEMDFLKFFNEECTKISKGEWSRTVGNKTISIKYVENGDASYYKLKERL